MESYGPDTAIPFFMGCFGIVIWLSVVILTVLVFCKIFSKAGYHWAFGLIMLIPIGNLVMLLILAFGEWPIQRQLRAYQQGMQTPPPTPAGQEYQNFRGV